jgi:hypothetical protein
MTTYPSNPDPRRRRDGLCAHCRKPIEIKAQRQPHRLEALRDPFCSSDCCRGWHGLSNVWAYDKDSPLR